MRALVTGGAGFIGGRLVQALVSRGDEVVVLDNLASHRSLSAIADVLHRVTFVHGDIRCPEDVERTGDRGFDRVFHLAASFANELSLLHPTVDFRSNVEGTSHVLAHARRVGCGLFVYAGSSSSYGNAPLPMREDGPLSPATPYATTKLEGERCVIASGLPHAILRLFNVYGPGDPPGRFRNGIPNMIRDATSPSGRLRVFGHEATRDFTYVDDVVRVFLDAERAVSCVVNVGSGVETAILDLAGEIVRVLDLPADRIAVEAPRPWDSISRRCASIERMSSLFGPMDRTTLSDGLRSTARWLRDAGHVNRDVA